MKNFLISKLSSLNVLSEAKLADYVDFCLKESTDYVKYETAKHHILPRAVFPEFEDLFLNPWNCAQLSNHNHYIAHAKLHDAIDNYSFAAAWYAMHNKNFTKDERKSVINPEFFSFLISKRNIQCSENNKNHVIAKNLKTNLICRVTKDDFLSNPDLVGATYGYHVSEETKAKISKRSKEIWESPTIRANLIRLLSENNPMKGKTHSEEAKLKMSALKAGKTWEEIMNNTKDVLERKLKLSEFMKTRIVSEETRKKLSDAMLGDSHPYRGKNLSDDHKNKISESCEGKKAWNKGMKGYSCHSEEWKKSMSGDGNPNFGGISEQHRINISKSAKNRKRIICPHCGKEGDSTNMKRWHLNNCKLKEQKNEN